MTRDEFLSLPPAVAVRALWDAAQDSAQLRQALDGMEKPFIPLPPRFDDTIYRKEGVMWASECNLETLRYWHKRFDESAQGGGQYADKDLKRARALKFWIEWRLVDPISQWSGKRFQQQVTAAPPSAKPTVYPREQRDQSKAREDRRPMSFDEEDKVADAFAGDEDSPF